jgi:homogentisate 1,2-dioxygenase
MQWLNNGRWTTTPRTTLERQAPVGTNFPADCHASCEDLSGAAVPRARSTAARADDHRAREERI